MVRVLKGVATGLVSCMRNIYNLNKIMYFKIIFVVGFPLHIILFTLKTEISGKAKVD